MTVSEAAHRLGVSPSTVYALCARRLLAHSRVGTGRGTIRISEEQLAAYEFRALIETEERETERTMTRQTDWRKAIKEEGKRARELARSAR